MSTDSFIMALRKFISRRGYPLKTMSDNGTNIVGANNELKKCLKELNQKLLKMNYLPITLNGNFSLQVVCGWG